MQVLRESQVALVSRNTRRLAGQQRGVALCKFSLENEVCALSIIGCPEVSGQSVHLADRVLRRKHYSPDLPPPRGIGKLGARKSRTAKFREFPLGGQIGPRLATKSGQIRAGFGEKDIFIIFQRTTTLSEHYLAEYAEHAIEVGRRSACLPLVRG
ncbi:hypothetical protein HN011_007537 [Eciton burchellii]|nr:hypothetical protein HN011_007537 [Eciton burchellii]